MRTGALHHNPQLTVLPCIGAFNAQHQQETWKKAESCASMLTATSASVHDSRGSEGLA
jgi:hypothetical protein